MIKHLYLDNSRIEAFRESAKLAAYYPNGVRHVWLFDSKEDAEKQMKKEGYCNELVVTNDFFHSPVKES
jgi:hypothetical protein